MMMTDHDELFVSMREALRELAPPTLAPGFDARVLARLEARRQREVTDLAMTRQFWRVAIPAAAAAVLMMAIASRDHTNVVAESVTLASLYALSADPTVQP